MRWQMSCLVLLAAVSIVLLLGFLSWPLAFWLALLVVPLFVGAARRIFPALPILAAILILITAVAFMIWTVTSTAQCPPDCYEDALPTRQWMVVFVVWATVALAAIGVGSVTEVVIRGSIQRDREWRLRQSSAALSDTAPASNTDRT